MPQPQIRTVTKTRRFSACHRHPSEPVTGLCALCLKDRLAGLDSSPAPSPELRRSKSVAGEKCKVVNDLVIDPRRSSCDVRARSTLSDLFVVDDTWKPRDRVDSMNEEDHDDGRGEIRVSDDVIVRDEIDDVIEGDLKTMKEIIDIELQNNRRNLRNPASAFSQKLRKWRQKQKEKKQNNGGTNNDKSKLGQLSQSEVADYGFGRRSCDTEPRFSIDAHRLSVEDQRFSLDEHRASWDGYMVARTIPRLTPMLSVVDNLMLAPVNKVTKVMENLQMHSISEDGAGSGGSGQLNSDSSGSNRGSGSSSSTKTVGFGGDDGKFVSNACVSPASDVFQGIKLVITEKELKDWRMNSIKKNDDNVESGSNAPDSTSKSKTRVMNVVNPSSNEEKKKVMLSRWRKVCNLWGNKQKHDDKDDENKNLKHMNSSAKHVGNLSSVNTRTRRDEFVLDRNRSTRYSTSDIDSGLLRLYLTPLRSSRRNKYGKSRAPSMQLH